MSPGPFTPNVSVSVTLGQGNVASVKCGHAHSCVLMPKKSKLSPSNANADTWCERAFNPRPSSHNTFVSHKRSYHAEIFALLFSGVG